MQRDRVESDEAGPPRVLIVRPRTGAPHRVPLDEGRAATVGRVASATIRVFDPTVSSIHARIEPAAAGPGHDVVDLESRNGTRVNDAPLAGRRGLDPGDVIEIGGARITYAIAGSPADTIAPPKADAEPGVRAPLETLVDDETSTIKVAPEEFDIDFAEPRTIAAGRTTEAALERRLIALYRASKTLTPIEDGAPVAPRLVKVAHEVLGAMRVGLFRAGAATPPELLAAACVSEPGAPFAEIPPVLGAIREALRIRRALLFRARTIDERLPASAIVTPLAVPGDPGLTLYADAFDPWPALEADDLRVLGTIARHASMCLANEQARGALVALNADLGRRVAERTGELLESAKLAAVGTLAAGVAHEFNNLLYVILGNAELARLGQDLPAACRERLDSIGEAGRRARDIVQDLLTFAHRRAPRREPLDLVELVETGLRLLSHELETSGVRVKRSFAALPAVRGESGQLSLVVLNLLKNARDALAEKGGGELRVKLGRRPGRSGGGAEAVVEIADDGIGMSGAVREHIFEPFFTTKPPGEGTGLGLSIAYGIVKAHGGAIEVESEPGRGTTLRIALPFESAEVVEVAVGELEAPPPPGVRRARILVCDDDRAVRRTLAAMLEMLGHEARAVSSSAEALAALEAGSFDVLLADYCMPGMDGLSLCAEVKRRVPGQKVALVTASADELGAPPELAAEQVLRKPFELRAVAAVLAQLLP